MRELVKALSILENQLVTKYDVNLNEAMALCSLSDGTLSASEISELIGLAASHTSKVIRSIENKKLIKRNLGKQDKRTMYFHLTDAGMETLTRIKADGIEIPDFLVPLF
jgi:Sugar-specific transcriptional regulator TrmB.